MEIDKGTFKDRDANSVVCEFSCPIEQSATLWVVYTFYCKDT